MLEKLNAVDMRLQKQIATEAANYVLADKKQRVLKQLILWGIYTQDQHVTAGGKEFLKMSIPDKQNVVYNGTLCLIGSTRWQEMVDIFKDVKPKEPKGFGRKS